MNFINEYGSAFGWTLIHMAWITLAVAICVQLIRLVIRNPRFNYGLGMTSMLSLPIIAAMIFGSQLDFTTHIEESANNGFLALTQAFIGAEEVTILTVGSWIDNHMDWILVLWFAGMISFIVRLLFGYTTLVGFRQSIQPMSDFWSDRFQSIFEEFNIKTNVLFGASKRVDGPMTFGFMKPMILLPIGLVNALSVDEVEAIIRHELAHIARHDYVFKMIQSAVESLFYYSPGTWWLTKMIDIDREQCCDDYAIRSGSNATAYVKALYKVNTFNSMESQLALGFGKEKNQLLNRVKRILKQPQEKANIMGRLIIPIVLLLVVAGVSINATLKDDTIETPNASIEFPKVKGNGKSYSVTEENGKITEMKVDGKKIDPQDYDKYQKELGRKIESDGFHFNLDTDEMTEEQRERFEESMQNFGQSMERFGKSFGEDFEDSMEEFGKSMEQWAEDFENNGQWKELEESISK